MSGELFEEFRRTVDRREERIDLGRAALAIACLEYPNLEIDNYLARIDQTADAVRGRLGRVNDSLHAIAALNYVIFHELGFRGNPDDYYDPKNSFLNEVIERRVGIPITLCVLFMEVARRIGLCVHGVGFPGHFLVKYIGRDGDVVIDPFNGGEIRSIESLQDWLREMYGDKVEFRADFLMPVGKKQILKRMLNNLKMIYLHDNELLKGLSVLERLLILDPSSAPDLRDRGLLYLKLECFRQALEDLESYLKLAPDTDDGRVIREQVLSLRKRVIQIQ